MKQIPPLRLREKYFAAIEKEINRIFQTRLYKPLLDVLEISETTATRRSNELRNASESALISAIKDGFVWYRDGHFYGEFNSEIVRDLRSLGARFNYKSKTWSLAVEILPAEIRTAQAYATDRFDRLRRAMFAALDEIDVGIDRLQEDSRLRALYGQSLDAMNDDFQRTIKNITITPKLTEAQRKIIADEYGTNLEKYIQGWAQENIIKLREKVQANAMQGRRPETLIKTLIENYGVSKNKAQFLARQETSLMLSKFRESRYKDAGSTRYRWSGVNDGRERPDHIELNGKVFSWDSPPVTDKRTGARNHPGEDYNCRCVAIALVD